MFSQARFQLIEHTDPDSVATKADEQPLLVVLALACVAAFLALACIALTLYIIKSLRSQLRTAWVPKKKHLPLLPPPPDVEHGPDKLDTVSDSDSEPDDPDEKYQDALDVTPLTRMHDLPLDDPPLPLTGSLSSDPPPTADRSAPSTRESCPSSISRPAWSVRAIDAPALGLSTRQDNGDGDGIATPDHPRRRAYRSAVPDLDLALAMQLRPGLGIGADSAWMVRFLMTIFGWFAVVLTSNGNGPRS